MARALTILKMSFFSNLKKDEEDQYLALGFGTAWRWDGSDQSRCSPRNEEFHQKVVSFRIIKALCNVVVDLVSTLKMGSDPRG